MGTINIQNVSKQFGPQVVLDDLSLQLHTGRIVGLVGRNGAGKTTLFKLIAGELEPDLGTVTRSKGLAVGHLAQDPNLDPGRTLAAEVADAFSDLLDMERQLHELSEQIARDHEQNAEGADEAMARYDRLHARFLAAGGYAFEQRMHEILGGLGFCQADYDLPVAALSGGQRCRAALGKLLLGEGQYLLLDEPTNHLDIDAVRWLEKFLAGHHGGAVVVSHDRYLLDRLADAIVELENGQVQSYPGNYTNYARVKALRRKTQERQFEKDQAYIEKERTFYNKHHVGQRHKEAQGRLTRLERRIANGEFVLDKPDSEREVRFTYRESAPLTGIALRADDLSKHYGDKALFGGLTLQVDAGERFGITGPNGTGKTTLLRVILGEVAADSGEVEIHTKAQIGYYAQHAEALDTPGTVLDFMLKLRPGFREADARSLLARFQFRGNDVFKRTTQLSGGEQSRLRLLELLIETPNVLILDEPSNHLDIPSREALEQMLDDYPGTIVTVSHDRYFLDRIVDRLLVIRPEGQATYAGNYSFYIEQLEKAEAARRAAATENSATAKKGSSSTKPPTERSGPDTSRFDSLPMERLEEMAVEHEDRLTELNARFADPAVYRDQEALARLREEIEAVRTELTVIQHAWTERVDGM